MKKLLTLLGISLCLSLFSSPAFALGRAPIGVEHHAVPGSVDRYSDQYSNNNSHSAAAKFVKTAKLHKSLSLLLLDSVKQDALIEQAIEKYGFETVKNTVVANIKLTSMNYREQWDGLLTNIYSSQFSADVLQSIASEGEASQHFIKFVAQQKASKTDQVLLNSNLFQSARDELMHKLGVKFINVVRDLKEASIDEAYNIYAEAESDAASEM